MEANLPNALTQILLSEGNKPNISPNEPGGASKFGVSVSALSDQHKAHNLPPATIDDVVALTDEQARAFYTERFASVIRFNELPSGVDYRLLDIEVNLGPTGGIQLLETTLGIFPVTGKMSDTIISKVKIFDPKALIFALGAAWLAKKHTSPNWDRYGHGWSNRSNAANAFALSMVI